MPDLRWVPAHYATDLVDEAGAVRGFIGPISRGTRAYVIRSRKGRSDRFTEITDHPTETAARAHVEAEVARIYGLRKTEETKT